MKESFNVQEFIKLHLSTKLGHLVAYTQEEIGGILLDDNLRGILERFKDSLSSLPVGISNKNIQCLLVSAFVAYLHLRKLDTLTFHNVKHTFHGVVNYVLLFLKQNDGSDGLLSEEDICVVIYAALFHDTGYEIGAEGGIDHEEKSAQQAISFARDGETNVSLSSRGVTEDMMRELILVTKVIHVRTLSQNMPVEPTLKHKLLADADMSHFLHTDFLVWSEGLREEINYRLGLQSRPLLTREKWKVLQINVIEDRTFQTMHAKKAYEETPVTVDEQHYDSMKAYLLSYYTHEYLFDTRRGN